MKTLLRRATLGAVLAVPMLASTALACPNCKETSNQGFEWGIYVMIGGVLTVGGAVVFFITRMVRALDAAQDAENDTQV